MAETPADMHDFFKNYGRQLREPPAQCPDTPLLDQVPTPAQLRKLAPSQLRQLADELRSWLVWSVYQTGGHLGAGMGVVELTVVLHYLMNTPYDRLLWDVGHQCYPHKILTGRREQMATLRAQGGLKGFPSREESPYDAFGTGHSSTALSAALGMAEAAAQQGEKRRVVAVVGDGALTGGMAYEALCDGGANRSDVLVVLNDNRMSISENTGGMTEYLSRITSSDLYFNLRASGKRRLLRSDRGKRWLRRLEAGLKSTLLPGGLFEGLGFSYWGPVNGHDIDELRRTLDTLLQMDTPRLLHIVTVKGKGMDAAERAPISHHAVGKPRAKKQDAAPPAPKRYQDVFGEWVVARAEADPRTFVITPAMREGSGLVAYAERFPQRYRDVAIAEQHAVTLAAGMACEQGVKPIVAIYSTFLQRGYDQVVHDMALQGLDVTLAVDRAGLIGEDGPTHAGHYDLALLRCLPGMVVAAPSDEAETLAALQLCYEHEGPAAVRYPRGEVCAPIVAQAQPWQLGRARVLRESGKPGQAPALLAFGYAAAAALQAAEGLDAAVVDMRFVKPLDEQLLARLADEHPLLVTLEDHALAAGAGSAVNECLVRLPQRPAVLNLGVPDQNIQQASRGQQLRDCGLDAEGIGASVRAALGELGLGPGKKGKEGGAEAKRRAG